MIGASLVAPTLKSLFYWLSGVSGIGLVASYSSTVTLGSILTAAAVIVVGGIFTLRNNLKTFWKERSFELEEKIRVLEEHAEQKLEERAEFAEQQREERHALKTELAEVRAKLLLEEAKRDLTGVFGRFDALEGSIDRQTGVLAEILAQLRSAGSS